MKTKLLFFLLSALFILPIYAASNKRRNRKAISKTIYFDKKVLTRNPLCFNLDVDEVDNTLIITFQSPLKEAEITVTDNTGNVVASESSTVIYEGKTVCIFNPESYPYLIEINSPQLDLGAEITLEEN